MKKDIIFLFLLFFSILAYAQNPNLHDLLERANDGDFDAQYQLGVIYITGNGVPEDCEEALKWIKKAAHQGEPNAMCVYGVGLLGQLCIEPNYNEALYWLELAEKEGIPDATHWIGAMYHEGLGGLEQNYDQALEYYKRSAQMGSNWGQRAMGLHYRRNIAMYQNKNPDYVEAIKWFKWSMDQGNPFAKKDYENLYNEGFRVEGKCGAFLTEEANKNIHWELSEDGVLVISGKGILHTGIDNMWWYFRDRIQVIRFEEGITGVTGLAFDENYPNLKYVYLPNSFETISEYFLLGWGTPQKINKSIRAVYVPKRKLKDLKKQSSLKNYTLLGL